MRANFSNRTTSRAFATGGASQRFSGVLFLVGQVIAWQQLRAAGLFLATNPSSSFFYVFTAAHGLHLLGGVLALTWILFRPTHRLTQGTATEVAAMYWHFMDGLWVFLFLLFLLGR